MNRIIIILFCFFLLSCARVSSPSGGDKDEIAPQILEVLPASESTNMTEKKVRISFDEFVHIKNQIEIFVSPYQEEQFEYIIKGKSIIITIPDSLIQNVTYTIDFGSTIEDNNENNKLESFTYVFSTGNVLDTLAYNGSVIDVKTQEPIENAIIGLYRNLVDSAFLTEPPLYVTRSNEEGLFLFSNIKQGEYRLTALLDQNSNFYFDQESEAIAFADSLLVISPTQENTPLQLDLFLEQAKELKIEENKKISEGLRRVVFNQIVSPLFEYSIAPEINQDSVLVELLPNQDTLQIFYWCKAKETSIILKQDTTIIDTLKYFPIKPKKLDAELTYFTNLDKRKLPYQSPLELTFNLPIEQIDTAKFMILNEDSTQVENLSIILDQKNSHKIVCNTDWNDTMKYTLTIFPNFVTSFNGVTIIDTIYNQITLKTEEDYGFLRMQIDLPIDSNQYLYQIMDGEEIYKQGIIQDEEIKLPTFRPGKYSLFIIHDKNANGKWDTGSWEEKQQPEIVFKHNEAIVIKANWETEVVIDNQ